MISKELENFKQSILSEIHEMMKTTGQVTQYIGARYVPLFADPIEWDDQREYEPLTVVLHQGNSYTTRQFTPKGIDISNEVFWANTGNYNAQIEQYRKEVATFDDRITAAQNTADSKAPINHATDSTEYGVGNAMNYGHVKLTDVISNSDSNNGLAATPKMVNDIKSDLSNRKHMVVVGDSYTATDYTDTTGVWCKPVANALGVTFHNFAISGTGFITGNEQTNYSGQLTTAANSKDFNSYNVEYVFLCGCLNDVDKGNIDSFYDAVVNTISKAQQLFINAKIVLVGPNTWQSWTNGVNSTVLMSNALGRAAIKSGAGFINTSFMGVGSNHYTNQGHPDSALQNNMAIIILRKLLGSEFPADANVANRLFDKQACITNTEHVSITATLDVLFSGDYDLKIIIHTDDSYVDNASCEFTLPFNIDIEPFSYKYSLCSSTKEVSFAVIEAQNAYQTPSKITAFNLKKSEYYYIEYHFNA